MTIGLIAAMHHEVASLLQHMEAYGSVRRIGMRDYYTGRILGQDVIVVLARVGKVAAAATTVTLIQEFKVDAVVMTGLAGGVAPDVAVGDVVVAERLIQHDLDGRPFWPQYQVPLLEKAEFQTDQALRTRLQLAAQRFFQEDFEARLDFETRARFRLKKPTLHTGMIASGDQFMGETRAVAQLRAALPHALCVEMEGAAVAQVCHEYDVPCAIMRTVSDRADDSAHVDFAAFLNDVASVYSDGVIRHFLAAH
jgi:adenosylhomocysteine nucleosidase